MKEVYKKIDGYENYEISNYGNVKNLNFNRSNKQKILKNCCDSDGYHVVGLRKNNKTTTKKVHRLVCLAFLENPFNKKEVNHINGIKTDNNITNLEWNTSSENQNHAYRIGLQVNKKRKLTLDQVFDIRTNCKIKNKYNKISDTIEYSKKYNVSLSTITKVIRNYSYKIQGS